MGPPNPAAPIFRGLAMITANDESVYSLTDYPLGSLVVMIPALSPFSTPDVSAFLAAQAAEGLTVQWIGVGVRFGVDFSGLPYAVTEVVPPPPVPTVESVSPATGSTDGGEEVTITGTGFTDASAVAFFDDLASFTVDSDTTITATTPARSAGLVSVSVATPGGTAVLDDAFTFETPAPPPFRTITPGVPFAFDSGQDVTGAWDGVIFEPGAAPQETYLVLIPDAAPGEWYYPEELYDPSVGAEEGVFGSAFQVLANDMSAVSWPVGSFRIDENEIMDNPAAMVSGLAGAGVTAAYVGVVIVVAAAQVSTTVLLMEPGFSVISVTPASGDGSNAIVTGSGFVNPLTLTFDGINAGQFRVTPVRIWADPPSHAPGAVDVAVTNFGGAEDTLVGGYTYE